MMYLKPLYRVGRHDMLMIAYEVPFADYYKFSYFPRTIREWNFLPNEAVNAPSITAFLKHLKFTLLFIYSFNYYLFFVLPLTDLQESSCNLILMEAN